MTTRPGSPDRLYELLPAMYRISDADHGEGLRALLRLVTGQADQLRDDIQQPGTTSSSRPASGG